MKNPTFTYTRSLNAVRSVTDAPYNMSRRHYHDKYEIYLISEGERYLFFDDKKFLVKEGDIFIIEPFVPHGTSSTDKLHVERYILNIAPDDLLPMLTRSETDSLFGVFSTCVLSPNKSRFETAQFYFKEILKYHEKRTLVTDKLKQMTAAQLIYLLYRELKFHSSTKLESITRRSEAPIMNALKYINFNFAENISLDFLSRYSHMSKSNFCLVFKKVTGETFIDYLNTIRIAHVHKLLLTTDMPLGKIAEQTGYSSVDYMTRIFKKLHGISPSALRKQT